MRRRSTWPSLPARQIRSIADTTVCEPIDRKSTRLNSSHQIISYAVFCLKKKNISVGRRHGQVGLNNLQRHVLARKVRPLTVSPRAGPGGAVGVDRLVNHSTGLEY